MIDWTDRYCRYFHRQLSRHARLYTEMIVDQAILNGDKDRLLAFDSAELPVALQLGGSDPATLREAAKIGASFGYDEINMNVGCPSDRVQSGTFGACLMREPSRVAKAVEAMAGVVSVPVTVKCRIGVDDQDPYEVLPDFLRHMSDAGCKTVIIHARKAWLKGLSPKENRTIPPLDYPLVRQMRDAFPAMEVVLNGGIENHQQTAEHLDIFPGVMLGRAAYERPYILADVDKLYYSSDAPTVTRLDAVIRTATHFDRLGVPVWRYARHMLGLFHGEKGARHWRQRISADARGADVTGEWLVSLARDIAASAPLMENCSV